MKRTFSLIIIVCWVLAACQPTPQEGIVVNKADTEYQETIESSDKAITKKIESEEQWETLLENGNVNIHINAKIITSDVEKYSILSVVPIEMDQEWVDKAIEVFAQDATLYEKIDTTKQTIEAKILNNKKVMEQVQAGNCPEGFSESDYDRLYSLNESLLKKYESAPDEDDIQMVEADTTFSEEYNGQFTLKKISVIGKINKDNFAHLYILNNGTIKRNVIQFYNYDNRELIVSKNTTEYIEGEVLNGLSITLDEAKTIAENKLSELGITDVELYNIKVSNMFYVSPSADNQDIESECQAYNFVYVKTYSGINVLNLTSNMIIVQEGNDTDVAAYSAVLYPEMISVEVDDSGIVFFNWVNPTYSDDIISENVELIDFEKIKEIFRNQVFYHYYYDDPEGSFDIYIDKITLSYFIEPEIDNPDEYIAVPVWDFIGYRKINEKTVPMYNEEYTYLTINAIDGSVINRDLGY